jgi:hypothetical protein
MFRIDYPGIQGMSCQKLATYHFKFYIMEITFCFLEEALSSLVLKLLIQAWYSTHKNSRSEELVVRVR